jgi:hypothetical protein
MRTLLLAMLFVALPVAAQVHGVSKAKKAPAAKNESHRGGGMQGGSVGPKGDVRKSSISGAERAKPSRSKGESRTAGAMRGGSAGPKRDPRKSSMN